jgi:predicted enzyme related to lactoylglutathione lyase
MSENSAQNIAAGSAEGGAEEAGSADAGDSAEQNWASGRPVHFEIQAADPRRAVEFYTSVFGWRTEDWSEYVGATYIGLSTGAGPGIDGAILGRPGGENAEVGGPVMGAVLTIGVDDLDAVAERITAAGGTVALPKYALPGMAWQGYFHDTENNVFGLHQPDREAK